MAKDHYTTSEAAKLLDVSPDTVLKWVKEYANSIPIRKIDGRWESDRESLTEWRRVYLLGGQAEKKTKKKGRS